jgi:predicted MPP superfamily phosphohydrolase
MRSIIFILMLAVYGLLNYYVGSRGLNSIGAKFSVNKAVYWGILCIFAVMYFVSMLGKSWLPKGVDLLLGKIGGYWLAAFVYFVVFVFVIDIFKFLGKKLNVVPDALKNNTWFIAICVVAAVAVILIIGTYNAIVPKVVHYDVSIEKKSDLKELKCAMISDVHLGDSIGKDRLHNAVRIINGLNADLVVIAGDLIDNEIEPVENGNMLEELKGIKSKYGVYAIMGNHEYYASKTEEIQQLIENNSVKVLRDKSIVINNSFCLVGREDVVADTYGYKRKELKDILNDADKRLPVIVLDHQPKILDEPRKAGVDLQLSGHTHAGQFFPVSLFTHMMYEEDHGYLKNGKFNLIVSSGYGTWGPTVRIGSQSEILDIDIKFAQ